MIVHALKGLKDIVDIYQLHPFPGPDGWFFSGKGDSLPADPLYGFKLLSDLYQKAKPGFDGNATIPVLWDKKMKIILNTDSSQIVRMLATAFDELLPEHLREANRPGGGLFPAARLDELNKASTFVLEAINNGVYKVGYARSQRDYDARLFPLFAALDRVEAILGEGRTYLLGDHLTDADVRLYVTLIRFDVAYHPNFLCNLKSIRNDYPAIYLWLRRLYWDQGDDTRAVFFATTAPYLHHYGRLYAEARYRAVQKSRGPLIIPRGPRVLIHPLPAAHIKQD